MYSFKVRWKGCGLKQRWSDSVTVYSCESTLDAADRVASFFKLNQQATVFSIILLD